MSDIKAANLARIRDNQRRSRARRKEYLQELESKYRACQQRGVEASAEVQAAARKVLEENRRLRSMLRDKGISEAEIESYHTDLSDGGQSPSSSANNLETMLHARKPCVENIAYDSAPWTPKQTLPSPAPQRLIQHQRAVELQQQCTSPRPSTPHSNVSPISASDSASSYSRFPNTPPAEDDNLEPGTFPHLSYQYDLAPNSPWPMPAQMQVEQSQTPISYSPSTSCVYAASIIRTMRTNVGPELENDLGCPPMGVVDCSVPNTMFFDVMDKYNHHQGP